MAANKINCMRTIALCVVVLNGLAIIHAAAEDSKPLTPVEAIKRVNEKVTVEMVVKASKNRLDKRGEIYLDSEQDFQDEKNLAIVIIKTGAEHFKEAGVDDPAAHFKGKTIRVRGTVIIKDKRPRIEVDDPKQIQIMDKENHKPAAAQAEKETLLRPEDYREWIFVGSSLGLRYDQNDNKQRSEELEYKNIYIDRAAYREYVKTGRFPQGTTLVLEIASGETKKEPGLRGSYQKEFIGLLAAVKDRDRFGEEWAYFKFTDKDGKLVDKARAFPKASCYDCHRQKAADDNVFTQFYPVLAASRISRPDPP